MGLEKSALLYFAAAAGALLTAQSAFAEVSLFGPGGKEFDIQDDGGGQMVQGTSDAYDGTYYLSVNGTQYSAGGTLGTIIIAGRGVRMAEHAIGNLVVQREAWAPDTGSYDYARYCDTIHNVSSGTETVTVTYSGDLGSDSSTMVTATDSGDTVVGVDDRWYCTDDSGSDPALGHLWYGDSASVAPTTVSLTGDIMTTTFVVDIHAGGRAAFVIFAVQADDPLSSQAATEWLAELPLTAQEGLEMGHLNDLVNWGVAGAPFIRFTSEDYAVGEGGERSITIEVEDPEGDPFTIGWDLDGDGRYNDGEELSVTFSAVGIDGPSSREIGVRATDGENERIRRLPLTIENVPPRFTSDPGEEEDLLLLRGQEWSYHIIVEDQANNGVPAESPLDPLILTVNEKPAGMVYTAGMVLSWVVPRTEEIIGDHLLSLQCSDGDGGITTQDFTLSVLENTPPGRPTIISPSEETVTTPRPALVIRNAVDSDGDRLSYVFQLATIGTFSTDAIVDRAVVNENSTGETAWTVNLDLEDETRYYWRVWAADDKDEGPAASTFFTTDLSHVPSDAADAADAPTDTTGDYHHEDKAEACSCSAVGMQGGGPGLNVALLFVFILGWVVTARRRKAH